MANALTARADRVVNFVPLIQAQGAASRFRDFVLSCIECAEIVFIENGLDDQTGWAVLISRATLKFDGTDCSCSDIRATPAPTLSPKLHANMKVAVRQHQTTRKSKCLPKACNAAAIPSMRVM